MLLPCHWYYNHYVFFILLCTAGTVTGFNKGVATFASLVAKCAPGHTLYLTVFTLVDGQTELSRQFEVDFRACVRGEYFAEGKCSTCEGGSYSLVEPAGIPLDDLKQAAVCEECMSHAHCPGGDQIVLVDG
jgi:hypothetical protein